MPVDVTHSSCCPDEKLPSGLPLGSGARANAVASRSNSSRIRSMAPDLLKMHNASVACDPTTRSASKPAATLPEKSNRPTMTQPKANIAPVATLKTLWLSRRPSACVVQSQMPASGNALPMMIAHGMLKCQCPTTRVPKIAPINCPVHRAHILNPFPEPSGTQNVRLAWLGGWCDRTSLRMTIDFIIVRSRSSFLCR